MRSISMFAVVSAALALATSALKPLTAQDTDAQTVNSATVERLTKEFLNGGKLDVLPELYTADAIHHSPLGDLNVEARKMTRAALGQAMPDFHVTIESLTTDGDWAAVLYTFPGTFSGELPTPEGKAVPGNNAKIQLSIGDFFRLNNEGRIVESWETYDNLNLLTQMGMMPAPGK